MYLFSKKRIFRQKFDLSYTPSTRYQRETSPAMVRSMYEGRIGQLERSLSREVIQKDRLRSEYQQLSSKLDQACRQMELLRSNSYSSYRGQSLPRTSVYSHFYPHY
ncbi:hypothetical protein B9Z55_022824 [Caenorhabditis nigoni]|uniref:Uncharacterized protein n=1 Tax=Caenorhabditis nigoni TaxID=1611254 RepID=A0A2G5SM08_9PELO|nr:hypothetical protein B9Z55_022824 [Caenorhabditis nigoni]